MRSRIALLATAAAVVLAGCGGTFGGTGVGAGTESPTLTPAPVPSPDAARTPVPADEPIAPGVTRRRVADPWDLARTHGSILANRSYTVRTVWRVRAPNGTVRARMDRRARVGPGGVPYLATIEVTGPDADLFGTDPVSGTFYADRGGLVWNLTRDGRRRYGETTQRTFDSRLNYYVALSRPEPRELVARPFVGIEVTGVERIDGGPSDAPTYRLTGTRLAQTWPLTFAPGLLDPREARLRATITGEGLVTGYTLAYAATYESAPVRVTVATRYGRFDETTVERPDWYDRAAGTGGTPVADANAETPEAATPETPTVTATLTPTGRHTTTLGRNATAGTASLASDSYPP